MKSQPIIRYFYRGEVERGNGKPGYSWHPGYSANSDSGGVLYPWMTIAECRQDASLRGCKAQFLVDPDYRFNSQSPQTRS